MNFVILERLIDDEVLEKFQKISILHGKSEVN